MNQPTRTTRSYAVLEIGAAAYAEIREKLKAAGYHHTFGKDSSYGEVIDLHGIAVAAETPAHPNRTARTTSASANQKDAE